MPYTFSFAGVELAWAPLMTDFAANLKLIGDTPRTITGELTSLVVATKHTWTITVVVGNQGAWLESLMNLNSFEFINYDGRTFTVRMTSLTFNLWPVEIVGTATVTLEEV